MTEKQVLINDFDKILEDFTNHLHIKINKVRYHMLIGNLFVSILDTFYKVLIDIKGPPGLSKPYILNDSEIIKIGNKQFQKVELLLLDEMEQMKLHKEKIITLLSQQNQ